MNAYTNTANILYKEATSSKSLLGQLVLNELEAFQNKVMQQLDSSSSSSVQYYINPSTLGTLIPTSTSMKSYVDMLNNKKSWAWLDYGILFKNVTSKILTLGEDYSFVDALQQIDKFREKAGKHFYGAILRQGTNKLVNPYHILTPISYMKHPEKFSGKFKVLLFFYRDRKGLEGKMNHNSAVKRQKELDELLNNIIKCANHKAEAKIPNNLEQILHRKPAERPFEAPYGDGSSTINPFNTIKSSVISAQEITEAEYQHKDPFGISFNENVSEEIFLAPQQIMVNGIFAPEYATSLIKKSRSSLYGTYLTPSISCNISGNQRDGSLTWTSVCTGRESQRTLEGISSIHCSNYASAYNSASHSNGSILLADLSIEKTTEIYKKVGLLTDNLTAEPTKDEIALWKANDFGAYLNFMITKYKLDLLEVETRYEKLNQLLGKQNGKEEKENGTNIS